MKQKRDLIIISFSLGIFLIILMVVSLIGLKIQAKPKLVSPVAKVAQNEPEENKKRSISYYITTSQEFLNQASSLANNNSDQTIEQKQEIIDKVEKALAIINQGIQAYPQDDRVYAQRASIYQSLIPFIPKVGKRAIADLVQATQINSKNPDYYRRLANLYQQAGDFENAASAFFNAYQLSPTDSQTLYNLAVALEKSGQIDKAIRYYDKLIALLPADDQNLETLKQQKANLEKLLVNANLEHLSEPGMEMVPQKPANVSQPILGTEELPLEQAAITSQVIIASPEEKQLISAAAGEISVNAKTGKGVLPAGETEVQIDNAHITNQSMIYLVPTSETENKVIYVKAKKAAVQNKELGWFKVAIDTSVGKDIEFTWWVIN